ncbi:MAG: CHASE2 domain-containing protein [Leptolyngbyaceae cyanobacterium bins.349]|nr:CHASE2 domain-containing protein [Leptolyngbyaceae cyanobacterium bins.349]
MQRFKQLQWQVDILPGLMMIGLISLVRFTGALQFLELITLDGMLRLRPPEPLDEQVVIIGITENDIQQVGTYPIPDQIIADLLQTLQSHQPAVIGLDIFRVIPVEPGHAALSSAFRTHPNIIGIEQALPSRDSATVAPPPALPADQVGFADAVLDPDGFLRRSLLAASNPQGEYRFSMTIQLARAYLAQQGIEIDNGMHDLEAFRFGGTELTRFQPNTGGYVGADAGGNQILLNFRSGSQPFRVLTLSQIHRQQFEPEWLRGKVVLIGVMALSVKDVMNTGAIAGVNPGVVYGVEIQAHAVSQIINAVLHDRPLLQGWADGWDYVWIIGWGLLSIGLGYSVRSPWKGLLVLILLGVGLIGSCVGLLVVGWWVPIVPTFLVLLLNGMGFTIASFYRYEQDLKQYERDIQQLEDRQLVIEHTFNTIHNGPLQTLAKILRDAQEQDVSQPLVTDLHNLNQELRGVYDAVRQEILDQKQSVRLGSDRALNLQMPLDELLSEVYYDTLKRDFSGFRTIKVQIVKLEPAAELQPSVEIKRGLCRFLEESLCNVGKHAVGATRLNVTCTQEGEKWVLRVADNGQPSISPDKPRSPASSGFGTRQAKNLAHQLGGTFKRFPNHPQGMVSELSWSKPSQTNHPA